MENHGSFLHNFHLECFLAWEDVSGSRACPFCHNTIEHTVPNLRELREAVKSNDYGLFARLYARSKTSLSFRIEFIFEAFERDAHEIVIMILGEDPAITAIHMERHFDSRYEDGDLRILRLAQHPEPTPLQLYYVMCASRNKVSGIRTLHRHGLRDFYFSALDAAVKDGFIELTCELLQLNAYEEEWIGFLLRSATLYGEFRCLNILFAHYPSFNEGELRHLLNSTDYPSTILLYLQYMGKMDPQCRLEGSQGQ